MSGDVAGTDPARPSPAFLESALAAIGHAVIATDLRGRVQYWNPAAEALYGYSAAEAAGRELADLIVPVSGLAAAARVGAQVRADGSYAGDWELRDKAGRILTVHVSSTAIRDAVGAVIGMLGVSFDVTERRRAEARARDLAAIVEGSSDVVVATDPEGTIRSANRASGITFGCEPADLIGRNIDVLFPLFPPETSGQATAAAASVRGGQPHGAFNARGVRSDGTPIDLSVRLSPIRDGDATVVGIAGIARDVTAERRTHASLLASEHRFRARFEQTDIPQAMLGMDGRFISVNNAACELVGRDRDQLVGELTETLRHPSDTSENTLLEVFTGHRSSETAERLLAAADGSPRPVLVHAALLHDADGTPSGVAAFLQDLRGLRAAERALTGREALFQALTKRATDWATVIGGDGDVRYVSATVTATFGYNPAAMTGDDGVSLVHPDDLATVEQAYWAVASAVGGSATALFRAVDLTGRWRWVEQEFTNCIDDPDIRGIICNGRDVTTQTEAEQALRQSEARYRSIAETAQEGIWAADPTGQTIFANGKVATILGVSLQEIYDRGAPNLLTPDDPAFLNDMLANREERGAEEYDLSYQHPDGRRRVLRLSVSPLRDDTTVPSCLAMISDVTAARLAEDELRHRALHDDLTGLANRNLLGDRLEQALARSVRSDNAPVAVLFADLDQFKMINDSWGHPSGDRLLIQVADRLRGAIRAVDTVARFGGDEFVVICEDANEGQALELADRLLAALNSPFEVDGQRAYVRASVGIAVSPPQTGRDLLRFAEAAMYDAKSHGRAQVKIFDVALAEHAADRLALSSELREALARDELVLHYQPIVELATGRVLSVEGLARWQHPTRGPVPPVTFVNVAETTGLAPALDRWALYRACHDAHELGAAMGGAPRVAVNISARHLADPDLEQTVLSARESSPLATGGLVLEITETAVMDNPEVARAVLERLRAHGVETAIDDFGTGYSSLGYLNRLPVSTLKIDRSFIMDITSDPDSLAITASIIKLAQTMRLTPIAEGIETMEQLTVLRQLGCTAGQGFLFSPARTPSQLNQLIAALPGGRFNVTSSNSAVLDDRTGEGVTLFGNRHQAAGPTPN